MLRLLLRLLLRVKLRLLWLLLLLLLPRRHFELHLNLLMMLQLTHLRWQVTAHR